MSGHGDPADREVSRTGSSPAHPARGRDHLRNSRARRGHVGDDVRRAGRGAPGEPDRRGPADRRDRHDLLPRPRNAEDRAHQSRGAGDARAPERGGGLSVPAGFHRDRPPPVVGEGAGVGSGREDVLCRRGRAAGSRVDPRDRSPRRPGLHRPVELSQTRPHPAQDPQEATGRGLAGSRERLMRAVFFGTPEWAVPSLDALAASQHEILAVVTQPDRRSSRRGSPAPPPVAQRAQQLGLELHQPLTVKSPEFREWLLRKEADLGVVVAYGEILPRPLLEVPPRGFVNLHFSLLPRYRGAAPVQWAIASGEELTGVTTMAIRPRLDAGEIYLQKEVPIEAGETASSLGRRLASIGAQLLQETLDRMQRGDLSPRPQDESRATYAPSLTKQDGRVDWSWTAGVIARRVLGFDPWPGCTTSVRGREMRLLEVDVEPASEKAGSLERAEAGELAPGTVLGLSDGALRVLCGEGSVLLVRKLQFEGGRPMTGREAVNGRLIAAGDVLG